ncbi:MAG: HD domain-containing protein [Peptoclostridium sp.]|uniref:3'-5' exoribonuclease YhaM family protein n=1 Tax=Peptoclostridium sp. TaxID=1904860 RepID=UPI00139BE20D|nr:OB-fold nucleic acid binding domain-containing protein [Peptoclostridium sp.]MZQ76282.1 HD domain-containing protein [Peptoclostridium sp.]
MNYDVKGLLLLEPGSRADGFFLLKSVETKTASNGKNYIDFVLSDKSGDVVGKLWESTPDDERGFASNSIVKVRGVVNKWKDSVQLKIERIRNITDEDGVNVEDFVRSAPIEGEKMYSMMLDYISKIESEDIRKIVTHISESKKDRLIYYPAAKSNHHAIRAGLLYHVTTMLSSAELLLGIYDFLDSDLLYAGIILHDISKLDEMDANELGIVSDYTVEGKLLGHIIQGIKELEVAGAALGTSKEVILVLQHMILSHHYEADFGSPKKPLIPEAEMLHHLDMIDARMYDFKNALADVNEGDFSQRVWSLENRAVYKPVL